MKSFIVPGLSLLLVCLFSSALAAGTTADPAVSGPDSAPAWVGAAEEAPEEDLSKDLEEELTKLKEELRKLEQDAREKLKQEVLPRIREEIQRLREKLRDLDLKDDEPKYRKT